MRKITKRSAAIIAATALAVGGAGAAWAAWTLSGSATASVSAGSAVSLGVSDAALTGTLVPGSSSGVKLTITNGNSFRASVTGATITHIASTKSGCDGSNFVQGDGTFPTTSVSATGTATVTWENAIKMVKDPADACQGAPVTFLLAVSGASDAQ